MGCNSLVLNVLFNGRIGIKRSLGEGRIPHNLLPNHNSRTPANTIFNSLSTHHNTASSVKELSHKLVQEFDPKIPVEEAATPPSSWYTDPSFYSFELDQVFYQGWQVVGYSDQIKDIHNYFTGRLGTVEFVVCRDGDGKIHAFHNVCRHHASLLAYGSGEKRCFTCPYHGWTYSLGGNLLKAPRSSGMQKFEPKDFGLVPIRVRTWGPFVVLNLSNSHQEADCEDFENEWLGSCSKLLSAGGVDSSLSYICRREYTVECNWKVFCDNYLDGGYHVPFAHKKLASGLNLDTYSTEIFEKVSIQSCGGYSKVSEGDFDRLGSDTFYAFVFPNFMINRYGSWMDTNLVLPLGPRKCQIVFDYFLDPTLKDDKEFIKKSLKDSEEVQMEDIILCEGVQRGIESPAYWSGRYAPSIEKAMHHFHCLLYRSLTGESSSS